MIVMLLGPPGSGKGTQSKALIDAYGWPQLSTGDMLRSAIAEGTELGMKAKALMDKGELVPDDVVIGLISERIQKSDCKDGFILDGFPRNIAQAETLDKVLEGVGRQVDRVILFEIEDEEVVRRLSGRRTCTHCNSVFHVDSAPPQKEGVCDQCGKSSLVQRDDDQVDVVRKRLEVYQNQTAPLIDYFRGQGKLSSVNAALTPEEVLKALQKVIGS